MNNGTIIAISWPETLVVKEGKWYDKPMEWIGVVKENHYKVGHAAMLLINHKSGKINYFDFGRYHTPLKKGRVRSEITDPDLKLNIRAMFNEQDKLANLESILHEVDQMPTSHGDGKTLASVLYNVNFDKAQNKILDMQNKEVIDYGPFVIGGTNCSRFVAQVARYATQDFWVKLKLFIPYTVSPTPLSNVKLIKSEVGYYKVENGEVSVESIIPNNLFKIRGIIQTKNA